MDGSEMINLEALKRHDPCIKSLLETASHVALYMFNLERDEWEIKNIEGPLFVYSRTEEPFHNMFILNRLSRENFVEPITQELQLQLDGHFLLYTNTKNIYGIWFYEKVYTETITPLLAKLIAELVAPKLDQRPWQNNQNWRTPENILHPLNIQPGKPKPDNFVEHRVKQESSVTPQAELVAPKLDKRLWRSNQHKFHKDQKRQRQVLPKAELIDTEAEMFTSLATESNEVSAGCTETSSSVVSSAPVKQDIEYPLPLWPEYLITNHTKAEMTSLATKDNEVSAGYTASNSSVVSSAPVQQDIECPLPSLPENLIRNQLLRVFSNLFEKEPDLINKVHEGFSKAAAEFDS